MLIKIKPIDTLFFRDGKPFSMGDQSAAFGVFPPYPSTLYGAIRTCIISQNDGYISFYSGNMGSEIGTPNDAINASFKIKGLFLWKNDFIFFPTPYDFVKKGDRKGFKTSLQDNLPFISNIPMNNYLLSCSGEKTESIGGSFLRDTDFMNYLLDSDNNFDLYQENYFCKVEFKTGIKRDIKSLTAAEGNLYRLGMRRFENDCAIVCDVEGVPSLKKQGILKLGGEGRAVNYLVMDDAAVLNDNTGIINLVKKSGSLKLYFATPALFEKGWIPDDRIFNGKDYELELITASLGNYISIGGWDMAKGGHKAMMRAVPAGSVYYFKITAGDPETIIEDLHYKNFGNRANEGFGLAFVGGV